MWIYIARRRATSMRCQTVNYRRLASQKSQLEFAHSDDIRRWSGSWTICRIENAVEDGDIDARK